MKKKYTLGIVAIVCVMFLSIVYYVLRVIQENNHLDSLSESFIYLITGNFTNTKDTEEEFEYESQMYNYLVQSNANKKNSVIKPINTTVGFESLLTSGQKTLYKLIKSNCDKISDTKNKSGNYAIDAITLRNSKLTPFEIKRVIYAIQNDNPDIFWIASNFSYQYLGSNTILKLNSILSKSGQKKAIKKLSDKVNSILSNVSADASDYQKELYVHDYIVKNCKYNFKKDNPKIYTSYGCLIDKAAVCEGYSKAMQLLLNTMGIGCSTVTGYKQKEPHMWNIVKIRNRWYHLDVTWDGSNAISRYNYFNLNDKTIKADHTINEEVNNSQKLANKQYNFKLPKCDSMVENYYEKNAIKVSSLDTKTENAIIKRLINLAGKKKRYLYIKITSDYANIRKKLIGQKPYKMFQYFKSANKSISKNKINTGKINYIENKPQKVLVIELFY